MKINKLICWVLGHKWEYGTASRTPIFFLTPSKRKKLEAERVNVKRCKRCGIIIEDET